MKINDVKHNHSLTDLLKILLFAILMLAPIGSVATRCLYVVCNKNAYQSYSGEQYAYTEAPITTSDIELNNIYHFNNFSGTYTNTASLNTGYIGISEVENIKTSNANINTYLPQASYIRFYYSTTSQLLYMTDSNFNNLVASINTQNISFQFDFRLTAIDNRANLEQNITFLSFIDYTDYSPLDNVFEYSISQLENDQLFSWTANTPVYTGVNAMCTQLGITGQAIPIILSYWLILTCIYVIIDIVIKLFTLLTHMISRKAG